MKKIPLLLAGAAIFSASAYSQLKIDNATFFISSGATVTVQGDVTSNVDIQGPGLLQLKGTTTQNVDMGGFVIPNLEIDNSSANINLLSNARIGTSLLFTNGRVQINGFDLSMASAATISGISSSRFVITNGAGRLVKSSLGATSFTFPVGYSATEFNPLTISNSGTVDDIGVRCLQNVLDQGLTGSAVTADFANNSWVVTEANNGGSTLSLTGEWASGDELANFNRVKSGIARYNTGTDWDMPASNVIAASGSGPYNRSRSNINAVGVFAIADLEKVNAARLNLKVFLQGAYNSGTGLMSDGLRTAGVIPTTQPYSSAMSSLFNRVGIYDGSATVNETVPNATVFDAAGTNDDIVDWVYVSLNDAGNPATKLQTRAALLQRDGDIVEYDPVGATFVPLRMPIDGDANYHLIINHRNHLGVRTELSQLLQDNTVSAYIFTDNQNKAYQDPAFIANNPAMKDLTAGVFGLWAGNVNPLANTIVNYTGLNNDALALLSALGGNQGGNISLSYNLADLNLNGTVNYTGLNNDALFLLGVLGSNQAKVIRQHQ
ncbi:MAG: hypothetical protein JNK14_04530 [Chitinophagaceae bacterium]|nr:hypothetical protein [Chitinophagaceae bacterium]